MAVIRLSKNVGSYQVSIEGKEEEFLDLVKDLDVLASKIDHSHDPTENTTTSINTIEQGDGSQPPSIAGATSAPDAVMKLFELPWGTTPKTLGEIKQTLDDNALFYPRTSLSGVLIKLARQGKLRRWKTPNGYSYVRGKTS